MKTEKKLLINIFLLSLLMMTELSENNYNYNDNGRIIIPSNDYISKLPKDGGDLWNRLIFESSPYLLQHAANPVDWYPWSEEAFQMALKLDKPIFLSIGYTTCHWCHVMEHESFEDSEVAALMNDAFINIKVDREERPDIDNIYMSVTQMVTGRGGWPMTIIMTPEKEAFFAGTYFPKTTRYSRIGMLELVPKVANMWNEEESRDSLISNAEEITKKLKNINRSIKNSGDISKEVFTKTYQSFNSRYDKEYGGFGSSPKFPKPHDYMFLANYFIRTKDPNALYMLEESLSKMRFGGIYDQIGFGFHRYSTDSKWLAPHFEKMLYDQALLIHAYLDTYIITGDEKYSNVVHEIIDYVLRDMTSSEGGFYSAEDADSEGEEGTFYIWKSIEILEVLGQEDGVFMNDVLNIQENGNWKEGKEHHTNIPHRQSNWNQISKKYSLTVNEAKSLYEKSRIKLFNYRKDRVHPQKDDKILTDWNGLMISALSRAASILDNSRYEDAAIKSMDFISNHLTDKDGKLFKRIRIQKGKPGLNATIEDYSFVIWGAIELYQLTFDPSYLELASFLSDHTIDHFLDSNDGSFYFTSDYAEKLLIRSKDVYDGAIPSGNSVSAYNFIRLGRILSVPKYEEISSNLLSKYSNRLNNSGSNYSMMMRAVDFFNGPSFEVLIFGDKENKKTKKIISTINKTKRINKVVININSENRESLSSLMPYIEYFPKHEDDHPIVYICKNYSCELPTSDLAVIIELLEE